MIRENKGLVLFSLLFTLRLDTVQRAVSENRLKTIIGLTFPILFFLAYSVNEKGNNLVLSCFFLLWPLFGLLSHFVKKAITKKEIDNFPNNSPYTITLTEEGIIYTTITSQTELKWTYFLDFDEFEKNFTLYHDKLRKNIVYLPLSLVVDNEKFVNLVCQKVKRREV